MKKHYEKPTLVKREQLAVITASECNNVSFFENC
jgi:hypothetical protein